MCYPANRTATPMCFQVKLVYYDFMQNNFSDALKCFNFQWNIGRWFSASRSFTYISPGHSRTHRQRYTCTNTGRQRDTFMWYDHFPVDFSRTARFPPNMNYSPSLPRSFAFDPSQYNRSACTLYTARNDVWYSNWFLIVLWPHKIFGRIYSMMIFMRNTYCFLS